MRWPAFCVGWLFCVGCCPVPGWLSCAARLLCARLPLCVGWCSAPLPGWLLPDGVLQQRPCQQQLCHGVPCQQRPAQWRPQASGSLATMAPLPATALSRCPQLAASSRWLFAAAPLPATASRWLFAAAPPPATNLIRQRKVLRFG